MKKIFLIFFVVFFSSSVFSAEGLEALTITTNEDGEQSYSLTLQVLILMTVMTLLPAMFLMMTSFTRIIIVLAILRQALGTAQTPSSQILIGIALFLTFFIMAPVFDKVYESAVTPYLNEEMTMQAALMEASMPMREFMMAQTREADLNMFSGIAGANDFAEPKDVPLSILVPSFLTSELKTAFQIGFLIFIPFLIVDMVVASVLMSMGMMMLSPMIISLPFKIMLFVLVDGWVLIVGSLASSFYT
ncbi:MAG: flagellar type III secretion system pore protein FliP [Gammaproteobacteria bacterium]